MAAKLIGVEEGMDSRVIADLAGSTRKGLRYHGGDKTLVIPDVEQAAAEAALADYVVNRAQREAEFATKKEEEDSEAERTKFDNRGDFIAVVKVLVEEINVLRTELALPSLPLGRVIADIRREVK